MLKVVSGGYNLRETGSLKIRKLVTGGNITSSQWSKESCFHNVQFACKMSKVSLVWHGSRTIYHYCNGTLSNCACGCLSTVLCTFMNFSYSLTQVNIDLVCFWYFFLELVFNIYMVYFVPAVYWEMLVVISTGTLAVVSSTTKTRLSLPGSMKKTILDLSLCKREVTSARCTDVWSR